MTEPTHTQGAYAGTQILDLSSNIAGPFATMILADLGADVIKVERPDRGDDTRAFPPQWGVQTAVFASMNRNKRSITLDLKDEADRRVATELAAASDVVVESFRPGVADRLQLGFSDLGERNPRLVYCSISGFGTGEIGASLPGYDPLVQAFSGLMSMTGQPGLPPMRVAASLEDLSTGMWAAIGIMAALARRDAHGSPQLVETSLLDTGLMLLCHQIAAFYAAGEIPEPLGSESPRVTPYGAYETANGWLMIAAGNDAHFERLCAVLHIPDLLADSRFGNPALRTQSREALNDAISAATRQLPTDELLEALRAAGVPASPVHRLDEALTNPLTAERDLFVSIRDAADTTDLTLLRLPVKGIDATVRTPPPDLGQHTAEILAGLRDPRRSGDSA
jgi:crotonobetainyl-CoA:carnitine CoA-transferase CaiB-like acyl-CoA transferase